jgi:glycosyltransferase involved in cell wall biosynthesis
LVSIHTEAVGSLILEVPPQGLTGEQVTRAILRELGGELESRINTSDRQGSSLPPFLASRREILLQAPQMTIVVCTRERPEGLAACLQSLLTQNYPNYSVLVVDNAPATDRCKSVVERLSSPAIQYVVEPRKGLSHARNRALEVVGDGIIAWIDDDETADSHWLAELARGFYDHPEADAIGGVMVPAELETWAQVWFEQYGGFNKLRGFSPTLFSPDTASAQSPLYPLPPFATGGNMAFRSSALAEIGGFDVALGAGSRCMGAEDTRAFTELLCLGGTVVYQPTAVTRHFHRRSVEELRHQMLGYGVGLTAFYTSLVLTRPRYIPDLVRLIPTAFRDLFGKDSLRSGALPPSFPSELLRANRRGALVGPLLYVRAKFEPARRSCRRSKRSFWSPVKSPSADASPTAAAHSCNEAGDSVSPPSVAPTARQSDS